MALLVKIGADLSSFQKQLSRATKDIRNLSKTMVSTGKTLTAGITLPVIAAGTAIVKVSADFEAGMSKVQAVTGATEEDMKKLEEQAKTLGSTTKFTATESAEAMAYLGYAGYSTSEILSSMPAILNLAAAGNTDLATTSDIVSDAMTAFGMSADETAGFADLLANVSRNANTDVLGLGEAFKYIAPLSGALGYSAEDTAKALGLMANAGIKGSQAGTSLRMALSRMTDGTGEAGTVMSELGIAMANADGTMRPLDDVLGDLRTSFAALSEEEQTQAATALFGKNAMSGMLAIINASDEDFAKLTDATSDYNGAAQEMADIMQDNAQGALTKLKSALEGVAIQLGEVLLPIFTKIIKKINEWVTAFGNLNPKTQEIIVKIAAVAAAIGPLLIAVGSVIGALGKLTAAGKIISTAIKGVSGIAGILSNPVTAIIALIAAVAAAVYLIYTHWTEIKAFLGPYIEVMKTMFANLGERINTIFSGLGDFVIGVWDSIKTAANSMGDTLSSVFETVKTTATNIFDDIKAIFKGVINFILKGINAVIGAMNKISITVPSWVPGIGGKSFGVNIPKVPYLANGGLATGATLAMIGEGRDKEAVLPLNDNIFSQIAKGINGAMSNNTNPTQSKQINATFNVRSAGDVMKELRILDKQLAY